MNSNSEEDSATNPSVSLFNKRRPCEPGEADSIARYISTLTHPESFGFGTTSDATNSRSTNRPTNSSDTRLEGPHGGVLKLPQNEPNENSNVAPHSTSYLYLAEKRVTKVLKSLFWEICAQSDSEIQIPRPRSLEESYEEKTSYHLLRKEAGSFSSEGLSCFNPSPRQSSKLPPSMASKTSRKRRGSGPTVPRFFRSEEVRREFPTIMDDSFEQETNNIPMYKTGLEAIVMVSEKIGLDKIDTSRLLFSLLHTLRGLIGGGTHQDLTMQENKDLLLLKYFVSRGMAVSTKEEAIIVMDIARLLAAFGPREFDFSLPSKPFVLLGRGSSSSVPLATSVTKALKDGIGAAMWKTGMIGDFVLTVLNYETKLIFMLFSLQLLCNNIAGHGVGRMNLGEIITGTIPLVRERDPGVSRVATRLLFNVVNCISTPYFASKGATSPPCPNVSEEHLLAIGRAMADNIEAKIFEDVSSKTLGRLLILTCSPAMCGITESMMDGTPGSEKLFNIVERSLGLVTLTDAAIKDMIRREPIRSKKELMALVRYIRRAY